MRRGLRFLGMLFLGGFVWCSHSTQAQSFRRLDLIQQHDLKVLFKKLYILGDRNAQASPTGLFAYQQQQMRQASRLYLIEDPPYENTRRKIEALFAYEALKNTYDHAFELQLIGGELSLGQIYGQLQNQSSSSAFDEAYRTGLMELELRRLHWACPVYAESLPVPLLSKHSLKILFPQLSDEEIEAAQSSQALPFDEFQEILNHSQPGHFSNDEMRLAYWRYLSLGLSLIDRPASPEEFEAHLLWAKSQMNSLPESEQDFNAYDQFIAFADFYYELLDACDPEREIEWNLGFKEEGGSDAPPLHALQWLELEFSERWLSLLDHSSSTENIQALESGSALSILKELLEEVEKIVRQSGWYEDEEVDTWDLALAQIESGEHFQAPTSARAFHQLRPELQNLLLVRLFPQFHLRSGRALVELRFHEIEADEQARILNWSFRKPENLRDFMEEFRQLDFGSSEALNDMHRKLVAANFDQSGEELQNLEELYERLTSVRLLDGQEIRSASAARAEMRAQLESDGKDLGFLTKWMMIHLFPYPGFLEDELKRFDNEWKRMVAQENLSRRYNQALEADNFAELDLIESEIQSILFTEDQLPTTDVGSFSVYFARFSKGAVDHPLQTLAFVGVGAIFTITMKTAGGKLVMTYLATESGVSLLRSFYRPDGISEWQEIGLENGITPVGRLLNEGFLQMFDEMSALAFSESSVERLQASYAVGSMSSDFMAFGLGARIASLALPWHRIAGPRKIRSFESKIAKTETKLGKIDTQVQKLRDQIRRLEEEALVLERGSSQLKRNQNELFHLRHRIATLETGLSRHYRGKIFHYGSQSLRQLFAWGRDLFLIPLRPKGPKFGTRIGRRIRHFRETYQMSRPQYEARLTRLKTKLARAEKKFFIQSTRPSWLRPLERIRFEWDELRFRKQLQAFSDDLTELRRWSQQFSDEMAALESKASGSAPTVKSFRHIEDSFIKAMNRLQNQSEQVQMLSSRVRSSSSLVDNFQALRQPLQAGQSIDSLRRFQVFAQNRYLAEQRLVMLRQIQSLEKLLQEVFYQSQHANFLVNYEVLKGIRNLAQVRSQLSRAKERILIELRPFAEQSQRATHAGGQSSLVSVSDVLAKLESGRPLGQRLSLEGHSWSEFISRRRAHAIDSSDWPFEAIQKPRGGGVVAYDEGAFRFFVAGNNEVLVGLHLGGGYRLVGRIFVLP